jgi:hypothetical protein
MVLQVKSGKLFRQRTKIRVGLQRFKKLLQALILTLKLNYVFDLCRHHGLRRY